MTRSILLLIATFFYLSQLPAWSQNPDRPVEVWFSSETEAPRGQWFQPDYPEPEYALSQQDDIPLKSGTAAEEHMVRIDPATRYQQIDGIGSSLDEYEAVNQQLTEHFYISLSTVKTHVYRIYEKFNAHNRSELIAAIRGLLTT